MAVSQQEATTFTCVQPCSRSSDGFPQVVHILEPRPYRVRIGECVRVSGGEEKGTVDVVELLNLSIRRIIIIAVAALCFALLCYTCNLYSVTL